MRLGVINGKSGLLVNAALLKAAYEICHACGFEYSIAAGRRSVGAIYRWMLFDDVLRGGTSRCRTRTTSPTESSPCRCRDFDRRWKTAGHSLYDFFARTRHPDIDVDLERVFETYGVSPGR
jgi:hypothetical protein